VALFSFHHLPHPIPNYNAPPIYQKPANRSC
jgi:hypothetical protein